MFEQSSGRIIPMCRPASRCCCASRDVVFSASSSGFVYESRMSGAVPPENSSPVPRNAKLKKLEPRIAAARNSLDWTALSGLLQQHVADAGRESLGGSSRQYTTAYMLARIDMHVFGERDGGLVEAVKFVNELLPLVNDRVLQCIIGAVHWCAGAQVRVFLCPCS
jgi:hypothetical protein